MHLNCKQLGAFHIFLPSSFPASRKIKVPSNHRAVEHNYLMLQHQAQARYKTFQIYPNWFWRLVTPQLVMRIHVSYQKVFQVKTQTTDSKLGTVFSVQEVKRGTKSKPKKTKQGCIFSINSTTENIILLRLLGICVDMKKESQYSDYECLARLLLLHNFSNLILNRVLLRYKQNQKYE